MLDMATDHPDDDPADVFGDDQPEHPWCHDEDEDEQPPSSAPDAYEVLAHLVHHALEAAVWGIEELAAELGASTLAGPLAELEAKGLINRWNEDPEGPSVMLSALSASEHGLRLEAEGESWTWVGAREPEQPWRTPKSSRVVVESNLIQGATRDEPHTWLDRFEDRKSEPVETAASRAERVEKALERVGNYVPDPPRPVILLGYWLPWPVQRMTNGCPGCSGWRGRQEEIRARHRAIGRKHAMSPALCLACDWYSHQYLIPDKIAREVERSKRGRGGAVYVRDERGLRGGIGA